ncbi:hypothetical protein F5Y04DRAFT_262545 [Hypomontagnella monticulosa]|nr:hypothetical protein F5Y04DRAFT_262545 [Hypomontagnella monticulosa]
MDLDSTGSSPVVTPGHRKSVPYGQACTNCSKAKCKCISRGGIGTTCERCQRLGKECIPSVSVRKRATRRPASERTAHLEEKLDDLVSILRAQAAGNPPSLSSYRSASNGDLPGTLPGNLPSSLPGASTNVDTNAGAALELDPCITAVPAGSKITPSGHTVPLPPPVDNYINERPSASTSYPTPPSVTSSPDGSLSLSPAEAEETLRIFQEDFLKFFPFIFIPPDTTAAELQRTKPFLWLNIITVCCPSQPKKTILSQKIKEYLAQKMLVDLDRNLDLLLGLLTYLGWGMHYFSGKPYIVAYINMASTIITDLRLDKPAQDNYYRELHCFKPSYPYPKIQLSTHRSNEERRATLACFILCSGISNFLRTQTMRWTAHMEDSLQQLATNPDCLNDEVLVALVKTYRIQEDVAQITWRTAEPSANLTSLKAPPAIYVRALRASVEAVRREIPPALVDNKVIRSHLYAAELSIADMGLWNINPWVTSNPARPPTVGGSGSGIDLGKLDAYYASLQASKASLENYLSFTIAEYACISFSLTLHFGRAAQTIYRLLLVDDPDWDRNIVKSSVDLMSIMERTADNYMRVPQVCGIETSDDIDNMDYYTRAANALRATIPMWSAALEQAGLGGMGSGAGAGGGAVPTATDQMPGPGIPEFTSMEWLDDPWLTDILRSWEGS